MLVSPQLPQISVLPWADSVSAWASLPLTVELSPVVLIGCALLVGVFIAGITVILLYHWRRFPFEHDTFRTAERIYLGGVVVLSLIAALGILVS